MQTLLLFLIVLLSGAICAVAGIWFYRSTREERQDIEPPETTRHAIRNEAWDRAVQAARNRNW